MIAFVNGVIKAVDNKGFESKTGEKVQYFEVYLQSRDENGFTDTSKINTKKDLSKFIDEPVVVKLAIKDDRQNSKLKVISILDVTPQNEE